MSNNTLSMEAGAFSRRQIALIAGFGLLLMVVAVGLAEGLGMAGIAVPGDPAATAANLAENAGRFRFGLFAHTLVVTLDMLVAWALALFLERQAPQLARLAGWLRMVYAVLYAVALFSVFGAFQTEPSAALEAFRSNWNFAYIFFGLHLAVLGAALLRNVDVPKWLGWLIAAGGVTYLFDYSSLILTSGFILQTSLVGGFFELALMVWLIWKGGKE